MLEGMWTLRLTSCDGFRHDIKRYQELVGPSRNEEWVLGAIERRQLEARPRDEVATKLERIEIMVADLQGAMEKLATNKGGKRAR